MTKRQTELYERLALPHALLSRTDLAELGLPRRGVDAVFWALDVVVLPGVLTAVRPRPRLPRACRALDVPQ